MAAEENRRRTAAFPLGTMVLLGLAACFYGAALATGRSSATGDAVVGEALAWFFCTVALWVLLTMLLLAGGIMGEMPRRAAAALVLLQPLAGAALLVSGDFYSRHRNLPPFEPAALPLLIAAYASWTRFSGLRRRFPPGAGWAVLGLIAAISLLSLLVASFY